MAFKSYLLPYAYLLWNWSSISFLYTTEKYLYILLVLDKWYSYVWWNLWTIFTLALTLNCLILLPRIFFWSNSSCLPCISWILVALLKSCFILSWVRKSNDPILGEAILHWVEHHSLNWFCILLLSLNMTSVWIICMESDDPIYVHFAFKCKIINNAQILGEQSYMLLNISCLRLIFDPDDVSLWKTNISRLGTLCHHEKCRGCGLFLDDIFINWYLTFIWYVLKVVSSIMCWFGSFDII